ncbi:MAG: glutaredoxin [Candidatus Altiarchaeota archaeon]
MRGYFLVFLAVFLLLGSASALDVNQSSPDTVKLYMFSREGCPHCVAEKEFLPELQAKYPELEVIIYEAGENQALFEEFARRYNASTQYVPATFIGGKFIGGFNNRNLIGRQIENQVIREIDKLYNRTSCIDDTSNMVSIPLIGSIDPESVSLPVFTIVLGGLDSFNPCAFFVLFFLLSLLVHARSRQRMLIIGGVFVFFSGLIYFIFMAAWLNVFLLIGQLKLITLLAGVIALIVSILNIKDFFFFKVGPSLSISDSVKPQLFTRMRNLVKATEYTSVLFGTAVLAIAANTYELLCTAGFPVVYTRVLTLNHLPMTEYYLYLLLYNVVYVLPLFAIVVIFTMTLGSRKLQESEGRILKLLSGFMMLALGLMLVLAPDMLTNLLAASGILVAAVVCTVVVAAIDRRMQKKKNG